MNKKLVHIIIVEKSHLIYEGIFNILTKTSQPYSIYLTDNLSELRQLNLRTKADIVIINPIFIQNQLKDFLSLKKELGCTKWIGIVYTLLDQHLLSLFDGIIYINDPCTKITGSIQKLLMTGQPSCIENQHNEALSEREIDVLKHLVSGNANKEIADKLNISTNTVITHRKNISQKTGIKSVSGLTIYAVVNNIITIDNLQK